METNNVKRKPKMKQMTIKLGENSRFSKDDLVDILSRITFELININLSTKKSNVGLNGVGYASVGFINAFNPEDCTFQVSIFENRVEAIEKLGDISINVRAFMNREKIITKVTGLDVEAVTK